MKKLKIKTGDTVRITAGDHKGTEGKVMRVNLEKNKAEFISNIALYHYY